MTDVVIVSAARTAVGKSAFACEDCGARAGRDGDPRGAGACGREARAGQRSDHGGDGRFRQNPARQSLIKAGLPTAVPGMTINKVCGSGLKAVMLAANAIVAGDADIVIAGGQERT